ncbi:MAG: two-component system, OmpR family, operon response regulator KdpE [Streptosporangiaceae bacterium]|nr:two-component system, OmpR family, operon response regulator KdpE [Streptosporangiaceae bacterium]
MDAVAPDEGAGGQHGSPAPQPWPAPQAAPRPVAGPAVAPAPATRVLIVDDEPAMLRALLINLRARAYDVSTAPTGRAALAEAARRPPDAIILDLGLPDVDGVEVIRELRGWSRAPVIVLSGRTGSGDKIGALDAGANDYVTKPFSMEELLARLRAVLRRDESAPHTSRVRIGRCVIDLGAHTVTDGTVTDGTGIDGTGLVRLTPTEWRLLEILLRSPGRLVGSRLMLQEVWGPGFENNTNYLRYHMARLRRKLEEDPARPRHLLTEPGMGYRYRP